MHNYEDVLAQTILALHEMVEGILQRRNTSRCEHNGSKQSQQEKWAARAKIRNR